MKIRVKQFIDFAYGDKRRDKAKVKGIIDDLELPYDPAKDRYKKFRDAMISYEEQKTSLQDFRTLHENVAANKSAGYKLLCQNYLDLKEDHALIWHGKSNVEAQIAGLQVSTAWYLRTEANNQRRIIFLHFGKNQLPMNKERGLLTVLRLAEPNAAGVGILNIQPGTLTVATRIDQNEADYLSKRAAKFIDVTAELLKDK